MANAHQTELELLRLIYDTTCRGDMTWTKLDDGHYQSNLPEGYSFPVSFDFQGIESHPDTFTSRAFINLRMPGMNSRYFNGTEGYQILLSTYYYISSGKRQNAHVADAMERFVSAFPQPENNA